MKSFLIDNEIISEFIKSIISQGPKIFLIILLCWLTMRASKLITSKMLIIANGQKDELKKRAVEQRTKTLSSIINNTLKVLVFLIGGMMILQELKINIAPIIASVGFVGLAFGFGAQSLVKDVVTGFFVIIENQYSVGDVIRINGIGGLVEAVNIRVTTLRDIEGIVHFIPNGQITTVSNMTKGWSRALLHIGVAYKENVDNVMQVIREVCDEFKKDEKFANLLLDDFEIPGVEELGDSSVVIRLMAKTKPLSQWDVMREMRRRIKNRFDEVGIEIPFPQTTVWMRSNQDMTA